MSDEVMKVAKESARASFFLISGTAISTVVLAISAILIARLLGSDSYGQYSLVIVIPQLLFLFTDLGLNQGITKFASDYKEDSARLVSIIKHGLLLRVIMGVVISIFTFVFSDFLAAVVLQRPELGFLVQLSAFSILFQVLFATSASAFVGIDKNEYNALTLNIQSFAKTLIQIVLIFIGFSVAGAVIGHVVSYLIGGVVGLVFIVFLLRKRKEKTSTSFSLADNAKLMLHYGSPLYLSTVLVGVVPLFQNIVLAFFVADAAIGNFKAATNFAMLLTVLSVPIQTIMLPAFSKIKNGANSRISDFFKVSNKYTALIVVPVTVLIITFSKPIVEFVYGATYGSAPQFLWTYSLVYLLVGVGYLTLASFYNGLGATKITMRISLITFVILAFLSPVLTSVYGVMGLIGAYLIANGVGQTYSSFYARRTYKVKFDHIALLKIYGTAILSSIVPFLIITYSGFSNIVSIAIGGVLFLFTYVTLMPVFKIMTSIELKNASSAIENIPVLTKVAGWIIRYQQKLMLFFS